MQRIKDEVGPDISELVPASSIPKSFLAALIANETGREFAAGGLHAAANAKRFESAVFASLAKVLVGEQASYGSISAETIIDYCDQDHIAHPDTFVEGVQLLRSLATSHGITQIMGYHILERDLVHTAAGDTKALSAVNISLWYTVALLGQFVHSFSLDPARDFMELFTCWNTGSPRGKTFDPNYATNGVIRMQLYEALQ